MARLTLDVDPQSVARIIREVVPRWRNLKAGDISIKSGPDDLVTIADRAAEVALTARLEALLPGSATVGEEAVAADSTVMRRFADDAPLWVIDPIDGTQAFATGRPEFTVMVALVADRMPMAGWIYAPATDTLYWAARGEGGWRQAGVTPERLARPPAPGALAQSRGIVGRRMLSAEMQAHIDSQKSHFKELMPATYAGHQYPWLYEGEVHFCLYSKSEPWDHLPGLAIATELGLDYTKHDGSAYAPGDNRGGLIVGHDGAQLAAIRTRLLPPA